MHLLRRHRQKKLAIEPVNKGPADTMSGAEASVVLGIITSIITIIEKSQIIYEAVKKAKGLPEAFRKVSENVPLVLRTLQEVEGIQKSAAAEYESTHDLSKKQAIEHDSKAVKGILETCRTNVEALNEIFEKVIRDDNAPWQERYAKAIRAAKPGRKNKIEDLMKEILEKLQLLHNHQSFKTIATTAEIDVAIKQLSTVSSSLPDPESSQYTIYGSGSQYVNPGLGTQQLYNQSGSGEQYNAGTININKAFYNLSESRIQEGISGFMAVPSRHYLVPFETVESYTERASLCRELEDKLEKAHGSSALAHAVAVLGLGGTGKTQLVLSYIERHKKDYDTIIWIDARSKETCHSSFAAHCNALQLRVDNKAQTGSKLIESPHVQSLLMWLRRRTANDQKWLVVMDNADDFRWDLRSVIPQGQKGTVIITSQDNQAPWLFNRHSEQVSVDNMDMAEAASLVRRSIGIDSTGRIQDVESVAEDIAGSLERFPLAIDLAGAKIREDVVSGEDVLSAMRRYLRDYRRHRDSLLKNDAFSQLSSYGKTVWTVWDTTLEAIQRSSQEHPSVQMLTFMSLFDRSNVQKELFRIASLGLPSALLRLKLEDWAFPPWLRAILQLDEDGQWDDYNYNSTLDILQRYNLIQRSQGKWVGATMHSLVQWRVRPNREESDWWSWFMIFFTAMCIQDIQHEDANLEQLMIVHFPTPVDLVHGNFGLDSSAMVEVRDVIAQVLLLQRRWNDAVALISNVSELRKQMYGHQDTTTLMSDINLAVIYHQQGKPNQAASMLETIRTIRPADDHIAALAVDYLVEIYISEERWKDAEKLVLPLVATRVKAYGILDPKTLRALNSAAIIARSLGETDKAAEYRQLLIKGRSTLAAPDLRPNDRSIVSSMAALASTFTQLGHWSEAQELTLRVLVAQEKDLGETHPETLQSMGHLVYIYQAQQKYGAARDLEMQALDRREKKFGADHPETLYSMSNLACILRSLGQHDSAIEMLNQCITQANAKCGPMEPDVEGWARLLEEWRHDNKGDKPIEVVMVPGETPKARSARFRSHLGYPSLPDKIN